MTHWASVWGDVMWMTWKLLIWSLVTDHGCKLQSTVEGSDYHGWFTLSFPCKSKLIGHTNFGFFGTPWRLWKSWLHTQLSYKLATWGIEFAGNSQKRGSKSNTYLHAERGLPLPIPSYNPCLVLPWTVKLLEELEGFSYLFQSRNILGWRRCGADLISQDKQIWIGRLSM